MTERWLVTGALGCIGSWVVRVLLDEGADVTTLDVDVTGHRLRALVSEEELRGVRRIRGDITSLDAVRDAFAQSGATHVVHLAALQIPFVRADPSRGMAVNAVGTVNMFEAAAATDGRVQGFVYASSVAAYDAIEDVAAGTHGDLPGHPSTLYGVTKRANEGTAQVYWQERSFPSIGLRPHTVYGPGRDQGLTSQPTQAMAAAVRGEPFHIGFGGLVPMQYARDVAGDFVAAARAARSSAPVVNLPATVAPMADIVAAIVAEVPEAAGTITFDAVALPFPAELPLDASVFTPAPRTSLAHGIQATIAHLRAASGA